MNVERATGEFLQHGLLGATIVVLGVVVVLLARHINKLHDKYQSDIRLLNDKLKEISEKRTDDAQKIVDKLVTLNDNWRGSINDQKRFMELLDSGIREVKEAIRFLPAKRA